MTPRLPRSGRLREWLASRRRKLVGLHSDQRGTISILTVFTLLMFTALLIFVSNAGLLVDDKLRMQNTADAAAYSGGTVLARGMNGVAFTNHLLADTFALVAFLREGRDRHAESLTPEILDEWDLVAQKFSAASFEKFRDLGRELRTGGNQNPDPDEEDEQDASGRIDNERELIRAFSELTAASAEISLVTLEGVLIEEMIPEFQRSFVRAIPEMAQQTVLEVGYQQGLRHLELEEYGGPGRPRVRDESPLPRGPQVAVLWKTTGERVGTSNEDDPLTRTLPLVDPGPLGPDYPLLINPNFYLNQAEVQRAELARHYLEQWTSDRLVRFDNEARYAQFSNMWRIFSCGQLRQLLDEHPDTNFPMVIRHHELGGEPNEAGEMDLTEVEWSPARNTHLEENYRFVAIAYRPPVNTMGPKLFRRTFDGTSHLQTFAEVSLFVPADRWRWAYHSTSPQNLGGTFGFSVDVDDADGSGERIALWTRSGWPEHWDALNQNWLAKLVPSTSASIPTLLQSNPGAAVPNFRPPNFGSLEMEDINRVNTH